jgi:hypothetical protein
VLEIPAANGGTIVGSVRDCWQTAIEDVGPAVVDKGKGGKYLILPPNYRETVQDFYTPMASANYQSITVRALPASREFVAAISRNFSDPDVYPTDARGLCFSYTFFSAKHLGQGQFYLMTIKDKDGNDFDGSKMYRLRVPANAPISQYWSATLYDRETHALIRDMKRPSRSRRIRIYKRIPTVRWTFSWTQSSGR